MSCLPARRLHFRPLKSPSLDPRLLLSNMDIYGSHILDIYDVTILECRHSDHLFTIEETKTQNPKVAHLTRGNPANGFMKSLCACAM